MQPKEPANEAVILAYTSTEKTQKKGYSQPRTRTIGAKEVIQIHWLVCRAVQPGRVQHAPPLVSNSTRTRWDPSPVQPKEPANEAVILAYNSTAHIDETPRHL